MNWITIGLNCVYEYESQNIWVYKVDRKYEFNIWRIIKCIKIQISWNRYLVLQLRTVYDSMYYPQVQLSTIKNIGSWKKLTLHFLTSERNDNNLLRIGIVQDIFM